MNEAWRLTIEIMDEKDIAKLSKTNKEFKSYIDNDSEYLYRKLLERDYKCITGYKELYQLLEATHARQSLNYRTKCKQEGFLNCDTLKSDIYAMRILDVKRVINLYNSMLNCFYKYNKSSDASELLSETFLQTVHRRLIVMKHSGH